jgi:hypothetical protein
MKAKVDKMNVQLENAQTAMDDVHQKLQAAVRQVNSPLHKPQDSRCGKHQ